MIRGRIERRRRRPRREASPYKQSVGTCGRPDQGPYDSLVDSVPPPPPSIAVLPDTARPWQEDIPGDCQGTPVESEQKKSTTLSDEQM